MCFHKLNCDLSLANMSEEFEDNQDIEDSQDIEQGTNDDPNDSDVFSILVATDIHLGYAEKNPIRSKDTFETFEEILKIAKNENVDFILLGGDLFHDTHPSTYCLFKCIELLKRYCLGDRPVQIEFLSDPSVNFSFSGNDSVNYEDPNLNVAMPVFSIHGNHDDPTGQEQISALNLVSSTGLVNYFGLQPTYESIELQPILLKKGESLLALYGLSHVKDERLSRLFLEKKVSVRSPQGCDDWFHLCVLHQNRANRGAKTFIPDNALPEVLDLVIWGHEHDCRITEETSVNNVYVSQPGSSVATSLCAGEAVPKHVGLLKIHKKKFQLKPIPLKTVRPFIFRELKLKGMEELRGEAQEYGVKNGESDEVITAKVVDKEVRDMIRAAEELDLEGNKLPLIRLNVTYVSESQAFNTIRFGQRYVDLVANPGDMIKMKSGLSKRRGSGGNGFSFEILEFNDNLPNRVEDLVLRCFEDEGKELRCLSLNALNEAVIKFVDANQEDIITAVTDALTKKIKEKIEQANVDVDKVEDFMAAHKDDDNDAAFVEKIMNGLHQQKTSKKRTDADIDSDSEVEKDGSPVRGSDSSPARGSTSRPARGPGSRGGRGSRRARGGRAGAAAR